MVPDSSLTLDEALDRLPKVELHCHIEGTMRLEGVDLDEVRSHILGAPGVADVNDLHAWRSRRA